MPDQIPKFCTQCGQPLPDSAAFCPNCGASTQTPTTQTPADQAAPTNTQPTPSNPQDDTATQQSADVPATPASPMHHPSPGIPAPQPPANQFMPPQPNPGDQQVAFNAQAFGGQYPPPQPPNQPYPPSNQFGPQSPMPAPGAPGAQGFNQGQYPGAAYPGGQYPGAAGAPGANAAAFNAAMTQSGQQIVNATKQFWPTKKQLAQDFTHLGIATGIMLVACLVVGVISLQVIPKNELGSQFGDIGLGTSSLSSWLTMMMFGVAQIHRAGISVKASASGFGMDFSASATIWYALLTFTAVLFVLHWFTQRRSEKKAESLDWRQGISRILISALSYSLLLALFALIFKYRIDFSAAHLVAGAKAPDLFGSAFLLVLLASLLARYSLFTRLLPEKFKKFWVEAASSIKTVLLGYGLAGLLGVLLTIALVVIAFVDSGALSSVDSFDFEPSDLADASGAIAYVVLFVILIGLLFNAIIMLGGLALGVPIMASTGGVGFEAGLPTINSWLVFVPVVAYLGIIVLGIRLALRQDPRYSTAKLALQYWGASAVFVILVGWLSSIRLNIAGDFSEFFDLGNGFRLSLSSGILLVIFLLVPGLLLLANKVLLPVFAGSFPSIFAKFRRGMHPVWALMLADATVRKGQTPPDWLMDLADSAAQEQVRPLQDRRKLVTAILTAIGAVILVIVAALVAYNVLTSQFGSKAAVTKFTNALEDAKTEQAISLLAPESQQGFADPAAMDAALKDADFEVISITENTSDIGMPQDDDEPEYASYSVKYSLNGEDRSTTVYVTQTDTRVALVFHKWQVSSVGTSMLSTNMADSALTLNGVSYDGSDVKVFPGNYQVEIPGNVLFAETEEDLTLYFDDYESAYLEPEIADGATDAIKEALEPKWNKCLASTELEPDGCPFYYSYYYGGEPTDVKWTAESELTIDSDDLSVYDGKIRFRGEQDINLSFTRPASAYSSSSSFDQTYDYYFYGIATVGPNGEVVTEFS